TGLLDPLRRRRALRLRSRRPADHLARPRREPRRQGSVGRRGRLSGLEVPDARRAAHVPAVDLDGVLIRMQTRTIRAWTWVHKWSSLVSTLFLLMLCITGLPLVFTHEIDEVLLQQQWEPANPAGPKLDLDQVLE